MREIRKKAIKEERKNKYILLLVEKWILGNYGKGVKSISFFIKKMVFQI